MTSSKLMNYLWQGGQFGYYWITPSKQSIWFDVNKIPPVPSGKRNVYFGVHPVAEIPKTNREGKQKPPKYIRAQNDSISVINAVFGEFDIKDFGSEDAIIDHLSDFPVPSAVVFSGGGFHIYWFLDNPFFLSDETREVARTLQANWTNYIDGDKQSKDIARVLRVPGTKNYKDCYAPNYPTVEIVDFSEKSYSIEFLTRLSEPPPPIESISLPPPKRSPSNSDKQRYANLALTTATNMVRDAVDGEKHNTLLQAAKLLGGYIAGGILKEQEATTCLETAIQQKENVKDLNGAYRTIQDGLRYGKESPITLEQKLAEREDYWRKKREESLYNHDCLDTPEWMTILTSGERSANKLKEAGFCAVGLNGGPKTGLAKFFKGCPKVFVAIAKQQRDDLISIAKELAKSGIETNLCQLPAEPYEFFEKYGGDSQKMFKFMMLGKKVI